MKLCLAFSVGVLFVLPNEVFATSRTVTLDVKNMVCQVCQYSVKKSLQKVEGVENVEVRLKTREAVVTYDDAKTSPGALTQATTKAGFPATVKESTGQ